MTSDAVSSWTKIKKVGPQLLPEQVAAAAMVAQAREQGLALTGPDGLLKLFTKSVLETALNEEMTEHLGYEKHGADPERESANIRNGCRSKTVLSDAVGEVEIAVPRDREGTFSPTIVKKRQRRLGDVDEIVLSLYARGLTTGEISAHFHDVYGASVSKETVSRITDKVVTEMEDGRIARWIRCTWRSSSMRSW
jgi:transposase-like protein